MVQLSHKLINIWTEISMKVFWNVFQMSYNLRLPWADKKACQIAWALNYYDLWKRLFFYLLLMELCMRAPRQHSACRPTKKVNLLHNRSMLRHIHFFTSISVSRHFKQNSKATKQEYFIEAAMLLVINRFKNYWSSLCRGHWHIIQWLTCTYQ